MDSLEDILRNRRPKEPAEIEALKRYILAEFGASASVGLHGDTFVITVTSASLANALRLRLPVLQRIANTQKRILFRIR